MKKILKFLIKLVPSKKKRKQLRCKYFPSRNLKNFEIKADTKCLIVAPHPDDEVIGCGGLLAKYKEHFDVVVLSSAGVAYNGLSAKERSDVRIIEFNQVMDYLGIKNHWIFETYGVPMFFEQIKQHIKSYLEILDFKKYDFIFLPYPYDSHPEHEYISKDLMKSLLKKNGYNPDTQIMFYEVWTPIEKPNFYEEIESVIEEKVKLINMYPSQVIDGWDYDRWTQGLNSYRSMYVRPHKYGEVYEAVNIQYYMNKKY